jgi:hypothetical protein
MNRLSDAAVGDIDRALIVINRITGRSFAQGEPGRLQALEFWAEYKSKP